MAASSEPANRRTGRPRRNRRASILGDPRDEILSVASQLFAERGVTATTMAEIARRSGLQQSSVYYYFGNREQVLEAIVAEANRAPLELVDRVRADGGAPSVQLYRMIRADVAALCALPYDLNELHRLAARDQKTFARYWRERDRLIGAVSEIVTEGIDAGELRDVVPRLAALTLLANDEATQNWLRGDLKRPKTSAGALGTPHVIGTFLADLTVRGLLVAPRDLDRVRRVADTLDARSVLT
jgi:AcrR family transcriptional regulator